jgi:hypothetical protein
MKQLLTASSKPLRNLKLILNYENSSIYCIYFLFTRFTFTIHFRFSFKVIYRYVCMHVYTYVYHSNWLAEGLSLDVYVCMCIMCIYSYPFLHTKKTEFVDTCTKTLRTKLEPVHFGYCLQGKNKELSAWHASHTLYQQS